jgi:predicted ArsR family transcriptional regulator
VDDTTPNGVLGAEEFAAAVAAVTSAFGDPTRRDIYLFVRDRPLGATATEVADRFELHPNVARHHLEKLAAGSYLEVHVERPAAGGAGRPSKHYRISAKDVDGLQFPVRRDDLLVQLLARLLAVVPASQAEGVAEEVGIEYGRSLARQMAPGDRHHRSFQAALHAVADALTAHGFAAHTESRGNALAIISESCPFGDAAVQHPVICAVDRGMVRGMLSELYDGELGVVTTESSRPAGDTFCTTAV